MSQNSNKTSTIAEAHRCTLTHPVWESSKSFPSYRAAAAFLGSTHVEVYYPEHHGTPTGFIHGEVIGFLMKGSYQLSGDGPFAGLRVFDQIAFERAWSERRKQLGTRGVVSTIASHIAVVPIVLPIDETNELENNGTPKLENKTTLELGISETSELGNSRTSELRNSVTQDDRPLGTTELSGTAQLNPDEETSRGERSENASVVRDLLEAGLSVARKDELKRAVGAIACKKEGAALDTFLETLTMEEQFWVLFEL